VGLGLSRISNARWDRIALIAVIAGAAIRAAWVLSLHPPLDHLYSDMGGYFDRAMKLASGGGIDRYDAFYPPGTHWILAVPLFIFGFDRTGLWAGAAVWWALSAFTPFAMWRFARYHLTIPAAALTAIFVSFWPIHIAYAGYFLSETPSMALLVGSLWLAARASVIRGLRGYRSYLGAGVLGGLAVANRPALIANLAVAIVSLPRTARLRALAGVGVGAAAILATVIVYNTAAAGKLTLTSENSGLTFWIGHCNVHAVKTSDPRTGTFFVFSSPPAFQRGSGKDYEFTDHMVWDQDFFYGLAFDCIRQDGVAHLRTLARGVLDMTLTSVPWPMAVEPDLGPRIGFTNALYSVALPVILAGAVWLIRERRRRGEPAGEAVMLAHFACVLLTAVLFFGDPRYRQPYDLFALALAASLIAYFFVAKRARATETSPLLDG